MRPNSAASGAASNAHALRPRVPGSFLDQPGLADPRLARDQQQPGLAGGSVVQERTRGFELRVPPHEDRADHARRS